MKRRTFLAAAVGALVPFVRPTHSKAKGTQLITAFRNAPPTAQWVERYAAKGAANFTGVGRHVLGHMNCTSFRGKPPGTVVVYGVGVSQDGREVYLEMAYRQQGWSQYWGAQPRGAGLERMLERVGLDASTRTFVAEVI